MPTGSKPNEPKEVTSILSLALRPRTLSGLYGQEATVKAIRAHMEKRPPRTWLFTGPPGSGKTSIARIMSIAFQCEHMKLWGDPCIDCRKAWASFAIHKINAAKYAGVEEVEKIAELSEHRPMTGLKRVIIMDECHSLSKQAWSSVLDPTEEPPETTVWIFCTSEASKLPIAIQRRCVKYAMKTLGIAETESFLTKQAERVSITRPLTELFEAVHTQGVGSPGILLQCLEKYATGVSASEAVFGAGGATTVDTFRICKAVTGGQWNAVRPLLKEVTSDDVRYIRASLSGWLKGILMKDNSAAGCERAGASILDLTQIPYDEGIVLNWTIATLHKITRRYSAR